MVMSASPSQADINWSLLNVGFGPTPDAIFCLDNCTWLSDERAPASRSRIRRIVYEYFNWQGVIDHVGSVVTVVLVRLNLTVRVLRTGQ